MKHIIVILIASCLVLSCEPTVFEVELPEHESKLVVQAALDPDKSIFSAWISKTVGVLDETTLDTIERDTLNRGIYGKTYWIPNATIQLFGDEQLIGTLTPNPFLKTYELPISSPLTATKYELSVNTADFPSVTASQSTPKEVPNISATFKKNNENNGFLDLSIDDPANEINYYEIYMHAYTNADSIVPQISIFPYLSSDDPSIIGGSHAVISDAGFDGHQFTAQLSMYINLSYLAKKDSAYSIDLVVQSITAERYLFMKSFDTYNRSGGGNPFVEPINLYSNIENGRGFFSVLREKKIVLK